MAIDIKEFMKTKYQPREKDVALPGLAPFTDNGAAVWRVRGLTGPELARVNQSVETSKTLSAITEGLASGNQAEVAGAIRDLLGFSSDVPQEIQRRIEMLFIASVDPVPERPVIVKLAEVLPVEFYALTNVILELTNQGKDPGKLKDSGKTRRSESPSPSATNTGDSSTSAGPISSPKAS